MTRALEQRRPQTSGIRQFGDLPPATSSMDLSRALELAGIDEPELVLLARDLGVQVARPVIDQRGPWHGVRFSLARPR